MRLAIVQLWPSSRYIPYRIPFQSTEQLDTLSNCKSLLFTATLIATYEIIQTHAVCIIPYSHMHMHTAQLLKSSCSLTELHLGGCDLGCAGDVTRLLEALKDNTTVIKLTLSELRYKNTVTSAAVYSKIKDSVQYFDFL